MINVGSKIEDEVLDRLRKVIWREMGQLCYIENCYAELRLGPTQVGWEVNDSMAFRRMVTHKAKEYDLDKLSK